MGLIQSALVKAMSGAAQKIFSIKFGCFWTFLHNFEVKGLSILCERHQNLTHIIVGDHIVSRHMPFPFYIHPLVFEIGEADL